MDLPQLLSNRNPDLNRKPYIKGSTKLVVMATSTDITRFPLEADYPGLPGEPATLTWSLSFDASSVLSGFVYFDRGAGTTSTEFIDSKKPTRSASTVTLVVVGYERLVGESFDVELRNSLFDNVERLPVLVGGLHPSVEGGREQTRMIWGGSTSILSFGAVDRDSPDSDGAGLSWNFFSRDGIAEGSSVVFSSTTKGGAVEVEVRRSSLDLYDVGSFVLEVTSPAGVKTTFTVTIETVCSSVSGEDLMTGQAGKGTSGSPYQIERLCQLQDISSNPTAHHVLVADIDASRTRGWNGGAGFEPLASFSGSFVSTRHHRESTRNYVISSLTISRSGTDHVGLFSRLAEGATIRGVTLVGSSVIGGLTVGSLVGSNAGVIEGCSVTGSVSGRSQVGGLVGSNRGGNISNSYATGSVDGQDSVGGLVGNQTQASRISNSYATGSVSGDNSVGGLAGTNSNAVIGYSYATGSVFGTGDNVGGLVGNQGDGSSISNTYATGSVFGTGESIGGLVGYQASSSIVNSYYAARGRSNSLGEERTFAQLRCPTMSSATCSLSGSDQRTYEDWDTNVWGFGSATDLPQLSSNRNSDLNLKPYISGSADLVVVTASTGITQLSLEADYLGPPGESVTLTWSLSGVPTTLRHLVYFDLGDGTTSEMFINSSVRTTNASPVMLMVVGNEQLAGISFYVVLKNDISASDDRIPIQVLQEAPTALTRPLRVKVYLGGAVR